MKRKLTRSGVDWTTTPEGIANYKQVRAFAQVLANSDGMDRGLEFLGGPLCKSYRFFLLTGHQYRQGHELRCEVVSCEDLSRCAPGHGPRGCVLVHARRGEI